MNENKQDLRQCWGCKTYFPPMDVSAISADAPFIRYGVASPECAKTFFDLLAFGMEQFGHQPAHLLVVDAYAVQHPRHPEIQHKLGISQRLIDASAQSPIVHLLGLYAAVNNLPSDLASKKVLKHILEHGADFEELKPPTDLGRMMAPELLQAEDEEEYTRLAWQWAHEAWNAWAMHHETIEEWYQRYQ